MKFFYEKLKLYRGQKNYSSEKLANLLNISRTTLWKWEKGITKPKESEVRMLAKMLEVSIEDISDLELEKPKSRIDLSEFVESWLSLSDFDSQFEMQNRMDTAIKTITALNGELNKASVIVKSLLMSIDTMFYIKDKSLNYLTANNAFLKNSGLKHTYKVFGSKDSDFFNIDESKKNEEEDQKVLISGKKLTKESFIPGTKKKKWGLITKTPTFDVKGDITGVLGTFVDLTEKKKQEKIRELIELNLNSMSAGFSLFDVTLGKYLYLNKQRENIYGYSNKTLYEGGIDFLVNTCIHPDFREKMRQHKMNQFFSGTTEYKIVMPDGGEKWIQDYESRIMYFNKICGISVITDITEKYEKSKISSNIPKQLKECIDFHGHLCPGLTYGYVIAKDVLNKLNISRAQDEELVMNAECDSCTIDAFQVLLGTTAGKGNLNINNYGKNIFTVYSRHYKKAFRYEKKDQYTFTGQNSEEFNKLELKFKQRTVSKDEILKYKELKSLDIISKEISELFTISEVEIPEPEYAVLSDSVQCDKCKEYVMVTKTVLTETGSRLCMKCAENHQGKTENR